MCSFIINIVLACLCISSAESIDVDSNPHLTETKKFVLMFNKFFDCMNVRHLKECVYKRKPDVRPYNSAKDSRIKES